MFMQDDAEAGDIELLSIADSAIATPVDQQLYQASDVLVNQLNIETRAEIGDSLLATSAVLQVRPDINSSLEHHFRPVLRETSGGSMGERTTQEVGEKNNRALQVDLTRELSNYDDLLCNMYDPPCDEHLCVLDSRMLEHEFAIIGGGSSDKQESCLPQTALIDGMIDGQLPSHTCPSTTVLGARVLHGAFGLPSAVGGKNLTANFSHAKPIGGTAGVQKRLSVEDDSAWSGSAALRNNGREESYESLPLSMPAGLLYSSATQLPASESNQVDLALESLTVTTQQKSFFDASSGSVTKLPASVQVDMPSNAIVVSSGSNTLPVAIAEPVVKHTTPLPAMSVFSPVGQITGTMDHLSIETNVSYPVLRGVLMEPVGHHSGGRDLKNCSTDQVRDSYYVTLSYVKGCL